MRGVFPRGLLPAALANATKTNAAAHVPYEHRLFGHAPNRVAVGRAQERQYLRIMRPVKRSLPKFPAPVLAVLREWVEDAGNRRLAGRMWPYPNDPSIIPGPQLIVHRRGHAGHVPHPTRAPPVQQVILCSRHRVDMGRRVRTHIPLLIRHPQNTPLLLHVATRDLPLFVRQILHLDAVRRVPVFARARRGQPILHSMRRKT
mmetsp:Transcript_10193/g.27801  ORF Transcript_10193/g.27801 Transcript_10193/m.27801 type:complete len:202 (-) Transcript_10193:402-1007(-)